MKWMWKINLVLLMIVTWLLPAQVAVAANDGKMKINNTINQSVYNKSQTSRAPTMAEQNDLFFERNVFDKEAIEQQKQKYLQQKKQLIFKHQHAMKVKQWTPTSAKKAIFKKKAATSMRVHGVQTVRKSQTVKNIILIVMIVVIFSGLGYLLSKKRHLFMNRRTN